MTLVTRAERVDAGRLGPSRRRLPNVFQCVTAAAGLRGATPKLPAGRPIGMHAAISNRGDPSSLAGTPSAPSVSAAWIRMTVVSAVPMPSERAATQKFCTAGYTLASRRPMSIGPSSSAGAHGMIGWRKNTIAGASCT